MKELLNEQFEDEVTKLFHEREKANTGRVVSIGDGIVRISGVTGAQSGHALPYPTLCPVPMSTKVWLKC